MLDFAKAGAAIGSTTATLEKTRILAEYLRTLDEEDLRRAAVFMSGRAISPSQRGNLGLGWSTVSKVITTLSGLDPEQLGQIPLRFFIAGSKFQPRLQLRDRILRFARSSQNPAQLQVDAGIIRPPLGESAQSAFRFRKALGAHVDVGQGRHRLYRLRIKSRNLLVLFLRAR